MLTAAGCGGDAEQEASPRRPLVPAHSCCCACFCSSFTAAAPATSVGDGSGGAHAGSAKCCQGRHDHTWRGASLFATTFGDCASARVSGGRGSGGHGEGARLTSLSRHQRGSSPKLPPE